MSMFITMGVFGAWQIAVIVLLAILLFGAKKIPDLMHGLGRGVKEFKDGVAGKEGSAKDAVETKQEETPTDKTDGKAGGE